MADGVGSFHRTDLVVERSAYPRLSTSSTVPYAGYPDVRLPRIEPLSRSFPKFTNAAHSLGWRETSWTCGARKSKLPFPLPLPEFHSRKMQESPRDRRKKIRHSVCRSNSCCAGLIDMDSNKPNMAKGYFVDRAIDDAAFILERIDKRWPAT